MECFLVKNGGGAPLNFKVVGNPQPTNPRENTIWINTDTAVTGYVFSAAAPSSPTQGMVWISTSFYSTSEFNALKKNGIQVYPSYAKQYVNGTWVTKEVKIYQGGAWKQPWDGKLFFNGAFRVISGLNGTGVGATVRIEGSNLFINADNEYAWPYSIERIDLTDVKTIVVKMESPSFTWNNRPWGGFGVCKNIPTSGGSIDAAYKHFNTSDPRGEYALDVSGLNGEYYLGFAISDTSGKAAVYYISEIRLER